MDWMVWPIFVGRGGRWRSPIARGGGSVATCLEGESEGLGNVRHRNELLRIFRLVPSRPQGTSLESFHSVCLAFPRLFRHEGYIERVCIYLDFFPHERRSCQAEHPLAHV
jgi:hypothetical protein